ncbi:MAG: hypothetical protein J6Y43_07965 [Clostridia bacterium]|nr:hypothetical protein [Clostridia bacterium]
MKISFFGHHDYEPDEKDKDAIISKLIELDNDEPIEFLLGGIGAFDMFARRCCLKYKKLNSKVKLTLVLPYLNRDYGIKGYDESVYPPLETVPQRLAIVKRNEWMVEQSDYIIAYVWHYGGARKTFDFAKRKHKPIFNLALRKYNDLKL